MHHTFTKKIGKIALLTGMTLAYCTIYIPSAFAFFYDTETSFYRYSIDELRKEEVIHGYQDGSFQPRKEVNRAEMMKIILRAKGFIPEGQDGRCFHDVSPSTWYAQYVCEGYRKGIIQGYGDGIFGPERTINWAEALKIALRAFDVPVEATVTHPWYQMYINAAQENNILSKHSYIPAGKVTRERMANLIYRAKLYATTEKKLSWKSKGCSVTEPQITRASIEVQEGWRKMITYIPDDYQAGNPKKLLFAFHGRTNPAKQVRQYYELEKYGNDEYIIIYPSGMQQSDSKFSWSNPGDGKDNLRDYTFFDTLLLDATDRYCIDTEHIYAVGHSLGSWFTNSITCARGNILRASGSLGGSTTMASCSGPAAAITMHNPLDRLSPFADGLFARDLHLEQNSCQSENIPVQPQENYHCVKYTQCQEGNPVIWCPHTYNMGWKGEYYPHTWPQGTGKHMLEFFKTLK